MNKFKFVLLLSVTGLLLACSKKVTDPPASQQELPVVKNTATQRFWKDIDTSFVNRNCPGKIFPIAYRTLKVDSSLVKEKLLIEGDFPGVVNKDTLELEIPLPDGTWEKFRINQVQVMAPVLAAKYPYIKTYAGSSMVYPADQLRMELNSATARIMILSTRGTILVEPACGEDKVHVISFFKKNMPEGSKEDFERK